MSKHLSEVVWGYAHHNHWGVNNFRFHLEATQLACRVNKVLQMITDSPCSCSSRQTQRHQMLGTGELRRGVRRNFSHCINLLLGLLPVGREYSSLIKFHLLHCFLLCWEGETKSAFFFHTTWEWKKKLKNHKGQGEEETLSQFFPPSTWIKKKQSRRWCFPLGIVHAEACIPHSEHFPLLL